MFSGSCHCGAVRFEVRRKPKSLTECNCSICHRYGARWAYYTGRTTQITYSPGAVTAYSWGDKTIEFYHCKRCGCVTHYESVEKYPDSRVGVNARMMEQEKLEGIRVRRFDGASTWKYLDE